MKKLSRLQKTKLRLLEETYNHYNNNIGSLCKKYSICGTGLGCFYSPKSLEDPNTISTGCAVGRLLHPKRAAKFDRIVDSTSISGAILSGSIQEFFEYSYKMVPPRLRKLGSKFLTELQILHDTFDRDDPNYLYQNIKEKIIQNKI